jgi:hypothetical protein
VAGLFEDQVTLRPLNAWLPKIKRDRLKAEAINKMSDMLPKEIKFKAAFDDAEDQYLFNFRGQDVPFTSLSDGYRAFIAWGSDLLGHMCDVTPLDKSLDDVSGIVLIDEIDLHLHPSWQRSVLPNLSKAFPKLQFIVTSHSPLVASAVRHQNIFITSEAEDGTATIKQIEEKAFGRGADQLLMSSYFGLETARAPHLVEIGQELFNKAAQGDRDAALTYLRQLSSPTTEDTELKPEVREALARTPTTKTKSRPKSKTAPKARSKPTRGQRLNRAARKSPRILKSRSKSLFK